MTDPSVVEWGRRRRPHSTVTALSRGLSRFAPLLPALGLIGVFYAGPVLWAVRTALTNTTLSGSRAVNPSFVGLDNFIRIFTDQVAIDAIVRTVVFVGASVLAQNILGMALALLMRRANPAVRAVTSTAVIGAWVVPEVVAAFTWVAFLNPNSGTLNAIMSLVGLEQSWLVTNPLLAVIIANSWRGAAFSMLIYSAAVADLDPNLTEAAQMDGASRVQLLRYVILPALRNTIGTNLMLTTLNNLGVFGLIFVMTAGGPNSRSQTLPLQMYNEAFTFSQIGYSNAIAIVLLGISAVFAAFYLFLMRRSRA